MKKILFIGILCGLAFYAGTQSRAIAKAYKMNRLENELKDIYSQSRHLEEMGKYIPVPEMEWEDLHKRRDAIIEKMRELEVCE